MQNRTVASQRLTLHYFCFCRKFVRFCSCGIFHVYCRNQRLIQQKRKNLSTLSSCPMKMLHGNWPRVLSQYGAYLSYGLMRLTSTHSMTHSKDIWSYMKMTRNSDRSSLKTSHSKLPLRRSIGISSNRRKLRKSNRWPICQYRVPWTWNSR